MIVYVMYKIKRDGKRGNRGRDGWMDGITDSDTTARLNNSKLSCLVTVSLSPMSAG